MVFTDTVLTVLNPPSCPANFQNVYRAVGVLEGQWGDLRFGDTLNDIYPIDLLRHISTRNYEPGIEFGVQNCTAGCRLSAIDFQV